MAYQQTATQPYLPSELRDLIWNMLPQSLLQISSLLQMGTNYSLQGESDKWFYRMRSIRDRINYGLKKEERKFMDKLEEEVHDAKLKYIESFKTKKRKIITEKKNDYNNTIRKYDHAVMDCLELMGLFPRKKNREKMSF